MSNIYFS